MNLEMMNWLKKTFGDRFMTSAELFRKSLNTVAQPAVGYTKGTLWIISDANRGEDIVRRHYEAMLEFDKELTGMEQKIDPYGGPRELAQRLKQQGYDMQMTIYPKDFEKMVEHATLYRSKFELEFRDVQAVCYNLDDRVMPTEEMEKQA